MHDLVIIGAGPAGMTALLYAQMYGLNTLCIGDTVGGKLIQAPHITDYPGVVGMKGAEFISVLENQLKQVKTQVQIGEVVRLVKLEQSFMIVTQNGEKHQSRAVLFATGNGNKQAGNRGGRLALSLGVVVDRGLMVVDEECMTSIPGLYAAGDCAIYPQSLEQIATAVAMGARVAAVIYEDCFLVPPPILWGQARIPRII